MSTKNVLIVEDEQITSMEIQEMVEEMDYKITDNVDNAEDVNDVLKNKKVDYVLMDIRLPDSKDGISIVRDIKDQYDVKIVYLTAHSDEDTIERAKETSPDGFLVKPVTEADIRATLKIVE